MGHSHMPLRCERDVDLIDMKVGFDTLRFAAENHPDLWDGYSGSDVPNVKITDIKDFAAAVVREINREEEDGSTLLTRMLDQAILNAVDQGCDGVDHDA